MWHESQSPYMFSPLCHVIFSLLSVLENFLVSLKFNFGALYSLGSMLVGLTASGVDAEEACFTSFSMIFHQSFAKHQSVSCTIGRKEWLISSNITEHLPHARPCAKPVCVSLS